MEYEKNNKEDNDIDEQYLMSIMAGSPNKKVLAQTDDSSTEKGTTRNRLKNKKPSDVSYVEQFLTHHTMTKRGDKSIYIRPEYHERLSRIIQIIADDQIPLYAYLDNILAYHFEMFEKEITDDFNNKYRPIF
ncbi:DUF3408 domain-containing protein [Chryseobacterium sp. B21-037]|uniref:DUF3408 domain-containing protein n=1 Tax=Chryseobacterium sp. B21-037 TaxID=2926038 RepID=UPI00235A0C9F|nr:DUF3408 domain-containing protein [Chryseobacterium sp. B21-037]MDC8102933.1 DUF3408 domain-containing protein [Chryseobacterium sp. B21-037]